MSFEAKKDAALQELSQSGIREVNYKPPALLLLWWLGIKVRPFHYNSFLRNTLFLGLVFTTIWAPVFGFLSLYTLKIPFSHFTITVAAVGCAFGLTMGIYFKQSAKKHDLSNWAELSNDK